MSRRPGAELKGIAFGQRHVRLRHEKLLALFSLAHRQIGFHSQSQPSSSVVKHTWIEQGLRASLALRACEARARHAEDADRRSDLITGKINPVENLAAPVFVVKTYPLPTMHELRAFVFESALQGQFISAEMLPFEWEFEFDGVSVEKGVFDFRRPFGRLASARKLIEE